MEFSELQSTRTILRTIKETDLEDFLHYRSNPDVARYQYWQPFTRNETITYINKHKYARPGVIGEWFQLGIVDKEKNCLIGDCSIKLDAIEPRNAEVGCSLSCKYQKKGIAAEVLKCLFAFGFSELKVHRISAITDCNNIGCIKLLERLGMRREGHFVKNIWFKGDWGSEYSYAILVEEWNMI